MSNVRNENLKKVQGEPNTIYDYEDGEGCKEQQKQKDYCVHVSSERKARLVN